MLLISEVFEFVWDVFDKCCIIYGSSFVLKLWVNSEDLFY